MQALYEAGATRLEPATSGVTGRYGVCEDEIDELLRGEVFVDLYRVVREALRSSHENYSLKSIEQLPPPRHGPVLMRGIAAGRHARENGDGAGPAPTRKTPSCRYDAPFQLPRRASDAGRGSTPSGSAIVRTAARGTALVIKAPMPPSATTTRVSRRRSANRSAIGGEVNHGSQPRTSDGMNRRPRR